MSRRYYTNPPTQGDIPEFLKKAYLSRHMESLIVWAKKEYEDRLIYLTRHATTKTIRFFLDNMSAMSVLSESEEFREAIKYVNETNYNKLGRKDRLFIRRTYELFKALS